MVSASPPPATALPTAPPAIEARGLSVAVDGVVVLSRVSLTLLAGTLSAIVGPAGAGKSTLLRCCLGRLKPRAGEIRVRGSAAGQARPSIGYLPQVDPLDWRFPLSVFEVVMMGRYRRLGLLRRPQQRDWAIVSAALAEVGLDHLARRPAAELDSGQRRRALLARALAQEPEVLLLDEPLQGVDAETEAALFDLIEQLARQGRTVVLATRSLAELTHRFERVVLLNGRVVAQGRPAEVLTEEHLRAAYGSQPVPLNVPAAYFAVDAGPRRR